MSASKPSALIIGGTGAVGMTLVRDALASNAFARVLTLGRRPVPTEGLTNTEHLVQKSVDFDKLDETVPKDEPLPTIVLTTLGTTRAQAGSAEGFRRIDQGYVLDMARLIHERAPKDPETGLSKVHFLYCSSGGANEHSYFLYPQVKGQTERLLGEVGFERVSIFRPAFLKTEGDRGGPSRMGEKLFGKVVIPALDLLMEKHVSVDVAKVGMAMRIVATSDSPIIGEVKPETKVVDKTKTTMSWYTNAQILELAKAKL
ncbi:hypothetical protein DFQ26_002578 [Actinomortierella ambigua]|nr:hypothetical protein DFQ26_002578 [Actinomortierella ambigua]